MRKKIQKSFNLNCKKYANNLLLDSIVFFIILFIFVIFGVVAYNFFTDIKVDLVDNDPEFLDNTSKDIVNTTYNQLPLWLDGAVITVMILFWIVLLGLTFVMDSHPIIWGIFLFLLIFVIFIAATLSNAYYEISQDEFLSQQASELPKTQWLMDRLPFVVVIVILSLMIALFMKSRSG